MYISVIPHITDAIQEWVERVAKQPVSNDEVEPNVNIHIYYNWLCFNMQIYSKILLV